MHTILSQTGLRNTLFLLQKPAGSCITHQIMKGLPRFQALVPRVGFWGPFALCQSLDLEFQGIGDCLPGTQGFGVIFINLGHF